MKVTPELKSFVKREFDKKIANLNKEQKDKRESDKRQLAEKISLDPRVIEARRLTTEVFDELCKEYPNIKSYGYGDNNLISKILTEQHSIAYYAIERSSFRGEENKLEEECERVLIRLTYGKDFEEVTKMLKEYGIEI